MQKRFYITTAIDYPNSTPHLGHAYEKLVTDSYFRWYRLLGYDCYFLTGLDENGQKLMAAAEKEGMPTLDFVNEKAESFYQLCKEYQIEYNDFIRTTEKRHHLVVQDFWKRLSAKDLIYFGKYSGQYCLQCEAFYTETQAEDGLCPDHRIPLHLKEEEGYFFRMEKFGDWILNFLKTNPDFIRPDSAMKEMIGRLESSPLKDLAVSRINQNWGIPVPGDERFVVYTWFDALINYYAAIATDQLRHYWPANVHVIGKDITWFHCVIWPIMMKALDEAIPHEIYVHGMILAEDGRKMSKSLGNGVDPIWLLSKYPLESIRYYLLRYISSSGDGRFSLLELKNKHNSELANDLGNLVSRIVKLSLKYLPAEIHAEGVTQELRFDEFIKSTQEYMDKRQHDQAIDTIWKMVYLCNQYINQKAPWTLKNSPSDLKQVVYNVCYGLHHIGTILSPFMPNISSLILKSIGLTEFHFNPAFGSSYLLLEPPVLFPKIMDEAQ